jgi:hypothetical protein
MAYKGENRMTLVEKQRMNTLLEMIASSNDSEPEQSEASKKTGSKANVGTQPQARVAKAGSSILSDLEAL